MRKILLLLIAISFISCMQTQKAVYQQEETYTQEERTLIVFYIIGKSKCLKWQNEMSKKF